MWPPTPYLSLSSLCNFVSRLRATSSSWRICAIHFTKLTLLLFSQFHRSNNNAHYNMFHWHNQLNRSTKWSNIKADMEYVWKTNLPSRAVCRTQGPRTCEAWSGGWPATGSWKLPDIQYCLNIENLGIAWPNIQYCLKEMLDIENRLASKTVPRNVKDFPTLWNKIMLMFVLAIMIIGVVFTRAKQWSMILVIRTFAKWWW